MTDKIICVNCGKEKIGDVHNDGYIISSGWLDDYMKEQKGKWVCSFNCYRVFYKKKRVPPFEPNNIDLPYDNLPWAIQVSHEMGGEDGPIIQEALEVCKRQKEASRQSHYNKYGVYPGDSRHGY